MTKILRIINRFNVGGPVNNALYLSKYLGDEFETKLIGGVHTEEEISAEFMFVEQNISYEIIPEMSRQISLLSDYKAYQKICAIIKEYQPDIVHTHASKAGLIGRLAAFRHKVPIVVHTFHGHVFHSYFGPLKTTVFIYIERFLAKFTSKIIAISPKQKEELVKEYKIAPESKFQVIPLGFDLNKFKTDQESKRDLFRSKYHIEEDTIVISIIGRLVPIKNHHLFIEAIAHLKKSCKQEIKAFIVGDGHLKKTLQDQAKSLGLSVSNDEISSDINFTSWIIHTEEVYAGSDIIALSSKNEGTPVTLIEAQVAMKSIVTTNVGGVKDILVNSESNIIARDNAEDFAKSLKQAIKQLEYSPVKIQVKEETLKKYTFTSLVKTMKKTYLNLASQYA